MEDGVKEQKTVPEMLDEAFPYYLLMGMTSEQFWEQDCSLAKAYRKMFRLKQERENYLAWLQGLYIYEALCDVSPVLHAFAKSGTQPRQYSEKPYEFETPRKKTKEETNREKMDKAANYMTKLASMFNRSMDKRPEGVT